MSETDQLRAEISELREAVLQLAHIEAQKRTHLFHLPKGGDLAQKPERFLGDLIQTLYHVGSIPTNTPNIQGATWLLALEKSHGTRFEDFRRKYRKQVDKEEAERVAQRKAMGA